MRMRWIAVALPAILAVARGVARKDGPASSREIGAPSAESAAPEADSLSQYVERLRTHAAALRVAPKHKPSQALQAIRLHHQVKPVRAGPEKRVERILEEAGLL